MVATAAPTAVAAEAATVSAANFVDSGVMLFRGRVKIGNPWNDGCDWENNPSGLNFPQLNEPNSGAVKCYKFRAPDPLHFTHTTVPFCFFAGIAGSVPTVTACTIDVEGSLAGALPPIFAAPHCGLSSSRGGFGGATIGGLPPSSVALSSLGWIMSAGTALPVAGSWDRGDGKGPRQFLGLVKQSGTTKGGQSLVDACLNFKGADSFDVNAVGAFLPVASNLNHPKD